MRMTSDPWEVLALHNEWATRRVLELCRGLSRDDFHRSFPIGPGERGGLHATLTHVVSAMRRWEDWLAGRPARPKLEPTHAAGEVDDARDRTIDELLALLREATAGLRARAREGNPEDPVHVTFEETSLVFTRGAALAHALTHGHYHRAQCMNMLRQLGVKDLPELDVVDWQYEEEGAGRA